jgi:hypothetical protein
MAALDAHPDCSFTPRLVGAHFECGIDVPEDDIESIADARRKHLEIVLTNALAPLDPSDGVGRHCRHCGCLWAAHGARGCRGCASGRMPCMQPRPAALDGHTSEAPEQHAALVNLCETVITVHDQVVMDTPEERELHDRAVSTFRARLGQLTRAEGGT